MKLLVVAALAGVTGLAPALGAPVRPAPTMVTIADGIYLFETAPYGDVGLDGNSIAIVSTDGVLVFDTNGTPAAAAAVLAEIRKLTPQPVRYVVNSHWHWDHWYGTEVYQKAFPGLRVVAQEATRRMMMGPALDFNKPGLDEQLPGYIKSLEDAEAKARAATPPAANLPRITQALDDARYFLDQKRSVTHVFPNVTFNDRLTLYLGEREIQVLHYDRAVTPGDTFLYLPKERVLITGDLLVNPISFALSCYPTGWLATLEKMDALDATVIVPGHGDPLHDKTLMHATMDVFRVLLREGKAAKAGGLDPDQARESIMPGLTSLMTTIAGTDPKRQAAFQSQLVDWYLHRVYDELDGPLTEAIAAIPIK
jgi:cyclase